MLLSKFENYIDRITLFILSVLAIGTPLAFTSLTRSVFEVNKMMVLRYTTVALLMVWVFRAMVRYANGIQADRPTWGWGAFKWEKIGLDLFLFLFFIFNVLSTVFSENIRLSIIGSYDRWEGIVTALNYLLLLVLTVKSIRTRFQIKWLVIALVIPTAFSAIYGVCQSMGLDFLTWSADPTLRVFACINNPVHYCAYMAMNVPLCVATLIYLSNRFPGRQLLGVKIGMFLLNILIFYAQYLSFSRATWYGFSLAMPLFFLIFLGLIPIKKNRYLIVDSLSLLVGLFVFYLYHIFTFQRLIPFLTEGVMLFSMGILVFWGWLHRRYYSDVTNHFYYIISLALVSTLLFFITFVPAPFFGMSNWVVLPIKLLLLSGSIFWVYRQSMALRYFVGRLLIVMIFAQLQFVALALPNVVIVSGIMLACFYLILRKNDSVDSQSKWWILSTLVSFLLVVTLPALPLLIKDTFYKSATPSSDPIELAAVYNVRGKLEAFRKEGGSARVSMWKTAIPWTRDYWLIGSGLDTTKFMYPVYRRPDYGILEGGHNFTPDRLHNEYLNNTTTRGIIASLIYYAGIILGWILLVLTALKRLSDSPYRFFMVGLMVGGIIYLGQVLFNFGVVATMVLFYICVGLSWAMALHPDFEKSDD